MKIVIVGIGKVGLCLTELLSEENHDVTVIDTDRKQVETAVNDHDVIGICGNGAAFNILEEAGVSGCDVFIAVTGNDELNIMSCMVASKISKAKTVARVRNTDYSEQLLFMQNKLGIDLLINPEFETAQELARIIEFPSAEKLETFAKGRIELAEITVTEESPLNGLYLRDVRQALSASLLICAVQRGDEVVVPKGNFVLQTGDRLHFSAARSQLPVIFKNLGLQKKKIKSVLIVGGSRTAFYLARELLKSGKKVKLIEQDRQRANFLEENLSGVSVICGDGTDTELLSEEGLENFDATVALTQIDEENIILSMYATKQGVPKTACKVNRDPLADMVTSMLEGCSVVCPKENTASIILRYIRATENATAESVQTLYKILGGKAEAAEFIVPDDCELAQKPLKELTLKTNVIIACVSRKKEVIIPDGNTVIKPRDSVIVITAGTTSATLSEILE